MLTMDRPRRGLRGLSLATLATTAIAMVSAGTALGAESSTLEAAAEAPPVISDGTLEQAQATVVLLEDELASLTQVNATLTQDVSSLRVERDRLVESITTFDDLYDPLEADRQLLFELRKGLPETRPEAEAQIARIQRLALSSNPARLGQVVDRVSETAPAFFDWRFTRFGSTEEATAAYIQTGANAFESSMEDFRSAVLLSVANRIDGLLNVIDRVR